MWVSFIPVNVLLFGCVTLDSLLKSLGFLFSSLNQRCYRFVGVSLLVSFAAGANWYRSSSKLIGSHFCVCCSYTNLGPATLKDHLLSQENKNAISPPWSPIWDARGDPIFTFPSVNSTCALVHAGSSKSQRLSGWCKAPGEIFLWRLPESFEGNWVSLQWESVETL